MVITTIITFLIAGLSALLIIRSLYSVWKSALRFDVNTFARKFALVYSILATSYGVFILALIINWLVQFLNPGMTGHPGPFALLVFIIAAITVTIPNLAAYKYMEFRHNKD